MIQIIIPKKTPSINHLYWHRGNQKIITKEGRELRDFIDACVKDTDMKKLKKNLPLYKNKRLNVMVYIHENWFTKDHNVARKDITNREKFLIDSVFKSLELDDKFIWTHGMKKVQNLEEEKAIIKIEVVNENLV